MNGSRLGEFVVIGSAYTLSNFEDLKDNYTDVFYDKMYKLWRGIPKKDCVKPNGKPNCINCGAPKLVALCAYCGTTT